MSESKILVIGSSNTDMVICTGHLPLPGETVIGGTFFMNPGGKGANQAVTVARLGGRVSFICKTGSDIFGHQANQLFNEEGIDTSYVFSDTKNPSGVALITVDTDAENCIVVAPGANAHLTPNDLKRSAEAVEAADIILLQLEIPMQTVEAAAMMAYRLGKKVVLNPAPASKLSAGLLETLYAITPNETEAEAISGIRITDERTAEEVQRHHHARCQRCPGLRRCTLRNRPGIQDTGRRHDRRGRCVQRGAGRGPFRGTDTSRGRAFRL